MDVNDEDQNVIQLAVGAPGAKNALDEVVGKVFLKEFQADNIGIYI